MNKPTAKDLILERLRQTQDWVATHELRIYGYSENCLATRCPELVKEGKIVGRYRQGQNYKEWHIAEQEQHIIINQAGQAEWKF